MSRSLCIIFMIFSFWIQNHDCKKLPQVKVIRTEEIWRNPKYIGVFDFDIVKHNETYNDLRLNRLEIKEDIPEDITLHSKVYVTDKTLGNERLLLENEIPICKENKYRELLPKDYVVNESLLGGKCFRKGVYMTEDKGQLRYDVLIPNLEKEGKYYTAHYKLGTPTEIISILIYYSEWGYLKDC